MFRRKRLPPNLATCRERFLLVLGSVERAKEELVAVVPSSRTPGRSLSEALVEFDASLRDAQENMPAWWDGAIAPEWDRCRAALEDALRAAEALRLAAPSLGFEALLATVGELLGPLDAFEAAAERFRSLRR